MNVKQIMEMCDSAKKLAENALKHVLKNLPDNRYDFQGGYTVGLAHEDSFTGYLSQAHVESIVLENDKIILVYLHDECDSEYESPLCTFQSDAAYWLLNEMEDIDEVPNYYDTPHTLLVYGEDECRQCQRLNHFDTEKTKSFINENEEEHILRRAFITKQERDAYIMGADDAAYCYDTEWIQNDGRYDKENSIL